MNKSKNKKMSDFYFVVVLVGAIIVAIGTYLRHGS